MFKLVLVALLFGVALSAKSSSSSASGEQECEVCTDVLTEVMKLVEASSEEKSQDLVRKHLWKYCDSTIGKPILDKQEKLCFFIGAHKQAATSIINDVTKPLSFFKPPSKVCMDLMKKDSQICDLKFDKPIDWDNLDLGKMRVKQLKELLAKLGDSCKGCTEKSDYVQRINDLKPKTKSEL